MIPSKPKKKTIRGRMILSNSIVIILAVIAIEIVMTVILVQSLVQDSQTSNDELVQTMSNSFNDMWNSFKLSINSITMDETFQRVLSGKDGIVYEYGEDNAILLSIVSDTSLYCNEIAGVYIYDRNGQPKTKLTRVRNGDFRYTFPAIDYGWFDESGRITTHIVDGRLIFSRIIYDKSNLECIGYIVCVYDESALSRRINTVVPSSKRFVAVFDTDGNVVTHNYPDEAVFDTITESLHENIGYQTKMFSIPEIGNVIAAQKRSGVTGWTTVSVISMADVLYPYRDTFLTIAVLGVLAIVLCFIVQYILARRITRPLGEIVDSITQAESGDYTDYVSTDTGDEIAVLGSAYNSLMKKIDVLVNQVLRGELAYRDAQLAALQSQINPHLLFNTLECVNWLAENDRKADVRSVTTAFSKLMKAMMSKPRNVTLAQELELTENFLLIYKILLGDAFCYSVDYSDVPLEMELPRLTIQPIVENALLHGIKARGNGNIDVVAADTPDGITISIIDDGVGMQPEQVQAVNAYAQGTATEEQRGSMGVGFSNVIDRLHLLYGGRAAISVSSSTDWGTIVRITLPEDDPETEQTDSDAKGA